MSTTLFLLFRQPGPSWVPGRPTREQPLWDEHADFVDGLFERGRIVMAGPYADCSRALIIVNAANEEAASALFDDDPWNTGGILVPSEVVRWTVFLDARNVEE